MHQYVTWQDCGAKQTVWVFTYVKLVNRKLSGLGPNIYKPSKASTNYSDIVVLQLIRVKSEDYPAGRARPVHACHVSAGLDRPTGSRSSMDRPAGHPCRFVQSDVNC
jgi:hypothetical protein